MTVLNLGISLFYKLLHIRVGLDFPNGGLISEFSFVLRLELFNLFEEEA